MISHLNDTNSFSATRARKKCGDFAKTTAFERYGVKISGLRNSIMNIDKQASV